MNRAVRLVAVVSLLGVAACGGETGSTSTTAPPSTTNTSPAATTTSTLPQVAEEGWVVLGPDGIRDSAGTVIWRTSVFAWHTLVRDGLGGFAFVDGGGLWWLQRGATEPRKVAAATDDLIEVIDNDGDPVARLGFCDSSYIGLADGSEVPPPTGGRVEINCDEGGFAARWTAANGLSAEIQGPEYAVDAEAPTGELLEAATLVLSRGPESLLELNVGGVYETYLRIHDFDGRRVILSRGPFEPALPEETFFLLDIATGETEWLGVMTATTAALRGTDTGAVEVADRSSFEIFLRTPLLTDNLIVELEDGRYVGFIDHVAGSGLTEGPEVHFDLAVWFSGKEADYAAAADGATDIPVPNDYYIRNEDSISLVLPVDAGVEVTSVWYHYDEDPTLESRPITFEELVDALSGEPVGARLNMWHDPWWITILEGRVVAIDEQYIP